MKFNKIIQGSDETAVETVVAEFAEFRRNEELVSRTLKQELTTRMRNILNKLNANLDNDLSELPTTTETFKDSIADSQSAYRSIFWFMKRDFTEADGAITNAISGANGPLVEEINADWQKVLDILLDEQTLSDKVKLAFDTRGMEAADALDVVNGQK